MSISEQNDDSKIFGIDRRVVVLGIARMADAMGNSFLIVVLPLYITSNQVTGQFFGISESLITGVVLGMFGLVSSICQPFAGRLSDRMGKRQLFVILGLVIFMAANFSYVWAHSYVTLMVIRTVQGMAAAMTITASVALVSELSEPETRGGNMGVYSFFLLLGFGAGPLGSGALVQGGPYTLPLIGQINGFEAAFCVAGTTAFVSSMLVTLFVRDPEKTSPSTESIDFRFISDGNDHKLDPFFALGLAVFIMSTGFSLLASIEPHINERLSQGAFMFSVEFSALIAMFAIIQPVVGKASDRYGRKMFIVIGLLCLVPITFAEGLVTAPWQMILARALQGSSAAMVFAPALALAGDLAKEGQTGARLSILTVAFGLGVSFGAFLSGYSIRFGFLAPFAVGAVLAALGAVLIQTQIPRKEKVLKTR